LSRLIFNDDCASMKGMELLAQHNEHRAVLMYMLAELLTKQSSSSLTEEQQRMHKKGIEALRAAVDALETQVYA